MAERRMFAKTIVLSDAFLDMPLSARCLYFTLGMLADDDGFVNNPKSIMRQAGSSLDDLHILIGKRFILTFDSGVIVIKHWRIHNYIQKDRYKESKYIEEKATLMVDEKGAYTECIQNVSILDTQDRLELGKDSLELVEDNIPPAAPTKPTKHIYGEYRNVRLTDDEVEKLKEKFPHDWTLRIENLSEGMARKGYKYKSHYLAILNWAKRDEEKPKRESSSNPFLSMLEEEYSND